MILEIGQKVRKGYGYYTDQVECAHDPNHRVIWWYHGVYCLSENKYVKANTKKFNSPETDI